MTTPLHQRGDLLDLIDKAVKADAPTTELLAAAAQRIRDLNGEYEQIVVSRKDVQRQLDQAAEMVTSLEAYCRSNGLDPTARHP